MPGSARRQSHEPPAPHTIRSMTARERPRERLLDLGASAMSDAELLAILLRTGYRGVNVIQLAQQLLQENGRLGGLARIPATELAKQKGIGGAKAAELAAAFELGRRALTASPEDRDQIKCPADAARLLSDMGTLEKEEMRVLVLNQKNRVVRIASVYLGSVHTTVVRTSELFAPAVRENAASVVIAHNHPSGDPTPSAEDVALTRELVRAGALLDIEVLDHLVIGAGDKFVSLKQAGLGFDK